MYSFIQRPSFFAVRIAIAVLSTLCEAKLCRTVVVRINERVGRYLFFMLLFSAGMWNAAPGIPSRIVIIIFFLAQHLYSLLTFVICNVYNYIGIHLHSRAINHEEQTKDFVCDNAFRHRSYCWMAFCARAIATFCVRGIVRLQWRSS